MGKIKQLFCNHRYIINAIYKIYLSKGDRYYNRGSHKYQMECSFCGKKQQLIKKWKVIQKEKEKIKVEIEKNKVYLEDPNLFTK